MPIRNMTKDSRGMMAIFAELNRAGYRKAKIDRIEAEIGKTKIIWF